LIEQFTPTLALLDIGLPVMDGYELARRLRELPSLAGIRLVAVSGYGEVPAVLRSIEAGFEAHLVKPVQLARLEQVIAGQIRE
jgi:CheY-like chemotaxis protein